MKMMGPIPGMSLTREPGNAPWEQPPLFDTVEQSLAFYLDKLSDEDTLDEVLFSLEVGYPVASMVDFLTSHSVMEGYHTPDVKMLVSPLLHEYIISLAEAAGVEYVEDIGPSKEERIKEKDKKRRQVLLIKALEDGDPQPSEDSLEQAEEMVEEGGSVEDNEEEAPIIQRRK